LWLRLLWPPALVLWIWLSVGRLGFAPLDEGLIASYSRRILEGQVPHRDIISVRPFGTALIHMVDLVAPLPLFATIRLDGIIEVVAYSMLFAVFLFERGPLRWTLTESLAVAASVLVNAHTFPLMSWYTFDGLITTAGGLVLAQVAARKRSRGWEAAAMICLGLGATVKQSFIAAPIAGLVILARGDERTPRALATAALRRIGFAAIPGLLYLAWLALGGALGDGISEMTSGRPVWGRPFLEVVGIITSNAAQRPAFRGHFPFVVALVAAPLLLAMALHRLRFLRMPLGVLLVALVVSIPLHHRLGYVSGWAVELAWALLAVILMARVAGGRWSGKAFALLLVAWMTSLSWGDELPSLVGGTLALGIVALALGDMRRLPSGPLAAAVALVTFVVVGAAFHKDRRDSPYFDRPASQLTFDLGRVDGDFDGIRTSPVTGAYLQSLRRCVRRFPAHNVAILPDNPGLYTAFGLHNPFPIDWFLPNDYTGQSGRIVAAAKALDGRGNYLVLFQIVSGFTLASLQRLPVATRQNQPAMFEGIYDETLATRLIAALHGRHIICGPFLGIYARSTGDSSNTGEPPRRSDSVAASSTATTRRAARTSVSGVAPV
jgi:hypothetical protein